MWLFDSLIFWISFGPLSDLLYRSKCHIEKESAVGSLVFAQLFIAGNSCQSKTFTSITLENIHKSSQISSKRISCCACITIFSMQLLFSACQEICRTELHTHSRQLLYASGALPTEAYSRQTQMQDNTILHVYQLLVSISKHASSHKVHTCKTLYFATHEAHCNAHLK